jgi:hypothetical protein
MLKKNFLHARSPFLRPIPLQGAKHHVPFSQSLLISRRRLGGPRQHWGGRLEGCRSRPTQVRTSKFLLIPSTSLQLHRGKRHYPALFFSSIPSSSFPYPRSPGSSLSFCRINHQPLCVLYWWLPAVHCGVCSLLLGPLAAISLALRERLFALFLLSRSIFNLISTTQALKLSCGPFEHA